MGGGTAYHTGADLNLNKPSWDSDKGRPVFAAANGVVTYAKHVPAPSTWGRLAVIRHEGGVYTRYAHMGSLLVTAGQTVTRGQQIGTIGGAEFGLPNHLHFDVSPTERLATYPLDWPGMTWSRIVTDYTEPLLFILARRA
jgi:murein DD-endopeptidase MepM/ murein hydrolase activator NlpD